MRVASELEERTRSHSRSWRAPSQPMSTHTNESDIRPPLNRNVRSEKSDWVAFAHGRAMRILSGTSEREEVFSSQLRELKREDSDTLGHLKARLVQREYTRTEQLTVWALIIALLAISVIAFYLLWAKVNGTL